MGKRTKNHLAWAHSLVQLSLSFRHSLLPGLRRLAVPLWLLNFPVALAQAHSLSLVSTLPGESFRPTIEEYVCTVKACLFGRHRGERENEGDSPHPGTHGSVSSTALVEFCQLSSQLAQKRALQNANIRLISGFNILQAVKK